MQPDPTRLVHQILREHGPMTNVDLLAAVRAEGARLTADDLGEILHDPEELPAAVCLPGGRHGVMDGLLAGRTFTHRLTESEIAMDALVVDPDLLMLEPLLDEVDDLLDMPRGAVQWAEDDDDRYAPLVDAGMDPDEVVTLPPGSLHGFAAGSVVALSLTGEGTRVRLVEPHPVPVDLGERIREIMSDYGGEVAWDGSEDGIGGDGDGDDGGGVSPMPVPACDLVAALCADDPSLFADALPPLSEMLEEIGLTVADGEVAAADFDIDTWRATKEVAAVAADHQIPIDDAMAVTTISTLVHTVTDAVTNAIDSGDDIASLGSDGAGLEEYQAALGQEPVGFDQDAAGPGAGMAGRSDVVDIRSARSVRASRPRTVAEVARAVRSGDNALVRESASVVAITTPLRNPLTAQALLDEALGTESRPAVALGAMVETWEPIVPRASRAALRWIRARCHERLGHADDAAEDLDEAQRLDPDWPPVLLDLARYASDRGEVDRAISLLRRAGVPDDDEDLVFLQGMQSPPRADIGRNQPCWCGSGRKYKVCHLGKEALPLDTRAGWLYRKMTRFATDGPYRGLILELAAIRSAYDNEDLAVVKALHDPLVMDAVMFEGGAAQDFLTERGFLLPGDERDLLESWLDRDRSVFDVEEVRPGQRIRVRDIRTGDRYDIRERTASREVRRGYRLLMRVVPVGDTWQIFGGIEPVPMSMEGAALALCDALANGDADPEDLLSFATARFAPPEMSTTDGQPMVFCTGRYRLDDAPAVTAELDRRFGDEEKGRWTLTDGKGTHPTVLGTMERSDDELILTTMNEQRFTALREDLEHIGGLSLIDVEKVPASEMVRRASEEVDAGPSTGPFGGPIGTPGQSDLEDSPEVQAVLEEYARDYEKEWLDMSIPALGGVTPRQAADDPTRRDDLIRLLDSFDDIDAGPGAMHPDRLRAALGL